MSRNSDHYRNTAHASPAPDGPTRFQTPEDSGMRMDQPTTQTSNIDRFALQHQWRRHTENKQFLLLSSRHYWYAIHKPHILKVGFMDRILSLTVEKFKLKCLSDEIDTPIVRLGAESQKAALGVHSNLAKYIDRQRMKAKSDHEKLMRR